MQKSPPKKRKAPPSRKTKTAKAGAVVIGSAAFVKFSAVEGIRLTGAMKKRAADAKVKGLSPKQTREQIIKAYRKA